MAQISTRNLGAIPDINTLQCLCKSLATLETIICRDWQYRYYSYNNAWDKDRQEEFFQMRNGSGDEFEILFSPHGAIINGLAHESEMCRWIEEEIKPVNLGDKVKSFFGGMRPTTGPRIWKGVADNVPPEFREFIFSEPVKSLGTTFCIWRKKDDDQWRIGDIQFPDDEYGDGSADLLCMLDNNPATYHQWAIEYYEEQFETRTLNLDFVKHIYSSKPLTKEIVVGLNPDLEDFDELKVELSEIGYEYAER